MVRAIDTMLRSIYCHQDEITIHFDVIAKKLLHISKPVLVTPIERRWLNARTAVLISNTLHIEFWSVKYTDIHMLVK